MSLGFSNSGLSRYLQGATPMQFGQPQQQQPFTPQTYGAPMRLNFTPAAPAPAPVAQTMMQAVQPRSSSSGSSGSSTPMTSGGLLGSGSAAYDGGDMDAYLNAPANPGGLGWNWSDAGKGAATGMRYAGPLGGLLGGAIGGISSTPASSDTNAEAAAAETQGLLSRYPAPVAAPAPAPAPAPAAPTTATAQPGYYGGGGTYNPATHEPVYATEYKSGTGQITLFAGFRNKATGQVSNAGGVSSSGGGSSYGSSAAPYQPSAFDSIMNQSRPTQSLPSWASSYSSDSDE